MALVKASASRYKKMIDLDSLQGYRKLTLSLNDTVEYCWFEYDALCWGLRTYYSLDGTKLHGMAVGSKSINNIFLVKLIYGELECCALIEKYDLDIVALTCDSQWKVINDSQYHIQEADRVFFEKSYPNNLTYEIGNDVMRSCVFDLNSNNPKSWKSAYYKLKLNISEPARYIPLHKILRAERSLSNSYLLNEFERWLVNNWGKLSKVVKLFSRYGIWDPTCILPQKYKDVLLLEVQTFPSSVAVLADESIELEIEILEGGNDSEAIKPIDPTVH